MKTMIYPQQKLRKFLIFFANRACFIWLLRKF